MERETILIADDDRVLVGFLSLVLREQGFAVSTAADAMQVMMIAHRTRLSAILLDILMPGGTGFEVLKRLRSNAALGAIPVIAMSASVDPQLSSKAEEFGADAFLQKPVQVSDVLSTLCRLLRPPSSAAPGASTPFKEESNV